MIVSIVVNKKSSAGKDKYLERGTTSYKTEFIKGKNTICSFMDIDLYILSI